jgi:hypothetical protein
MYFSRALVIPSSTLVACASLVSLAHLAVFCSLVVGSCRVGSLLVFHRHRVLSALAFLSLSPSWVATHSFTFSFLCSHASFAVLRISFAVFLTRAWTAGESMGILSAIPSGTMPASALLISHPVYPWPSLTHCTCSQLRPCSCHSMSSLCSIRSQWFCPSSHSRTACHTVSLGHPSHLTHLPSSPSVSW